ARRPTIYDLAVHGSYALLPTTWRPQTDVVETSDQLLVTVELAGVAEEDIEIVLHEDALVVEGERRPGNDIGPDAVYHSVEIRQGSFRVEVPLPPVAIDDEGIDAALERGLLRVRLPKQGRREIRITQTPGRELAGRGDR
ncbi:MAG: Hsp20/alpha crystallin family protein, partial [Chloroflexota bacterium]|nr:Hsp20/alpha crystallin family protein [Chloroflexota bacterium]